MFSDLLEVLREFFKKLFSSRLFALAVIFTALFAGLTGKLFQMQILNGADYQETYMQRTEKEVFTPGTRGNIYDRNGVPLAYNELAYTVTIQDTGAYSKPADRNAMIYRLVTILNQRGETVEGKFEVGLDDNGELIFTSSSESAKRRFLLNFYGISSEKLDDSSGKYPSNITPRQALEKKKESYELNKMKDERGNPLVLPDDIALDMVNIIYTMKLTEYQKYETTTVAANVKEETMMEINENIANLQGVAVERSYIRKYNDSIYFAPIIGYTGKVPEDQLSDLNERWRDTEEGQALPEDAPDKYDLNDIVGRIGIEQTMELELQGEKGYSRMYVDNMGRPREIIEQTDPQAGNDVYLTIDRDLQVAIYNLMEQQLAGILTYWLRNQDINIADYPDASKRPIPVKDAYYQLINNNVLSLSDMAKEDASAIEQEIYRIYETSRDQILTSIRNELMSPHAAVMNDLPEDMASYMNYIYTFLSSSDVGIVQRNKIDQSSELYQSWRNGAISLRDYLYGGISESWIDTTQMETDSKYSNADDIFNQLTEYIIQHLSEDIDFTKLIFRYLVNDEVITGRQLCLALYAQGVLAYNEEEIAALEQGDSNYTFNFMLNKINNLELTPAQLALDPCTAGCVVTDVKTGEVLALVTYPSYDNNQMSGSVDPAYFAKLRNDLSNPLYNNATQARKAPGSTFKPITAVAALEEGVVDTQEVIVCTGIYDQVSKPIKCWISPGRHNAETIVEGIQNSCNYFFAELAHRLSIAPDGTYSPEQGLETIRRYASMFGLDHTSGVEITENEPQLTGEDPERSAMGQGTHMYTNTQLSRYIAALANRGTVFQLSLLDKLTDSDGNLITDYTPEVYSQIDISDLTWDTVHAGMRRVITNSSARSIFSDLPVEVAGKTGTAQEDKNRPNHAFFVSFAPYSHPEIAVTVNIPNGYAGTNAATLGKKVYEYYYGYTTLEQVLGSGALGVSNVTIGD